MFWLGMLLGFFVGANVGVFVMALFKINKK